MLTDSSVRNAKPKEKIYKLSDGQSMYLEIAPSGGKWWRLKYRTNGKEKRISLGTYPTISLKEAREARDKARKLLANGIDPSQERKSAVAAKIELQENNFETIAREWFNKNSPKWVPSYSIKIIERLERDIFPWIGTQPIALVTAPQLLKILTRIEERGAIETAHRALRDLSRIFRYAIAVGKTERNPAYDLKGALQSVKKKHLAAIVDINKVAGLMRAIHSYEGSFTVKCALKFAPLVFVRPGELRAAEWQEIDLKKAEWNIPATKMKMRSPLLVPLSKQAVHILEELQPLTGYGKYVFPSPHNKFLPMSNNAILAALRRMGFSKEEMTGHGFRAMARTILDEELHVRPDYIEQQLGHAVRDPNGRAYNRTTHLVERKKMMQLWSDYLEKLQEKK